MRIEEVMQQPGQKERLLKENIMKSIHVAVPGEVVSYDAETRTAIIQPVIRGWGEKEAPPLLVDVPVYMWGNFTFEPQEGDGCLVVCADSCIDAWMQSGGVSSPVLSRCHSLSDGFAFVGFRQTGGIDLPGKLEYIDNKIGGKLDKQASEGLGIAKGQGNYSYCKLLTITIPATYYNRPISIELSGRGKWVTRLHIMFANVNNTDPALEGFYADVDSQYYIYKASAGTWEIYAPYVSAWGEVTIHRVLGLGAGSVEVTIQNTNTLPTSAVKAVTLLTNSMKGIQKKVFRQIADDGSDSVDGISAMTTTPGVHRVTAAFPGLPAGAGGYGTLLVFYSGYYIFIYVNYKQDFYYAQTTFGAPTSWYKLTGTEVGLTT